MALDMSPGCNCCVSPCADATITVNARRCDTTTAYSGRAVRIINGSTTVASGTTDGAGQYVATVPAASGNIGCTTGGIVYTVEVDFASETRSTTVRVCCGGSYSVTLSARGCVCLGLAGKTVTLTTSRGSYTMTYNSGTGLFATTECVPTTEVAVIREIISSQCTVDCASTITDADIEVLWTFRCEVVGTTNTFVLVASYRRVNCGGVSTLLWRPIACGSGCVGPAEPAIIYAENSVTLDTDAIDACDRCDATSLIFSMSLAGLSGLGTEAPEISWV